MDLEHYHPMIEFGRAAEAVCGYKPNTPDLATAVHEAAHAVIGRVLGFECGKAVIKCTAIPEIGGFAHVKPAWVHNGRVLPPDEPVERSVMMSAVEANIIVGMSGVIGVNVVLNYWHESPGDGSDRARIEAFRKVLRWPGGWKKAARQRLEQRTYELVDQHRHAIGRVALALLERRTLQAEEIDALMKEELHPGEFR